MTEGIAALTVDGWLELAVHNERLGYYQFAYGYLNYALSRELMEPAG